MKLSAEQKIFLNVGCNSSGSRWVINKSNGKVDVFGSFDMANLKWKEIPVKFGKVSINFCCQGNNLTSLKNCPDEIGGLLICSNNQLTNYFKNIKEGDFPHWDKLSWNRNLGQMPFLINIAKKYISKNKLKFYLNTYPLLKLYYKD